MWNSNIEIIDLDFQTSNRLLNRKILQWGRHASGDVFSIQLRCYIFFYISLFFVSLLFHSVKVYSFDSSPFVILIMKILHDKNIEKYDLVTTSYYFAKCTRTLSPSKINDQLLSLLIACTVKKRSILSPSVVVNLY